MFTRLHLGNPETVTISVDGQPVTANQGDSVAAAMLAVDVIPFRTTRQSAAPRAPYCMMGVCFECLVEVDGLERRQACMIQVREGMRITRLHGAGELPR